MAKKQEKQPRQPSKRQLARWQREKRRQRIILGVTAVIVLAVFVVLGIGFYTTSFLPMRQTAVVVNGTSFSMAHYLDLLRHYSRGADESQLYNIASQLPDVIERNELIRQGALAAGVEVSNSELDQELAKANLPRESREAVRPELIMKKLRDEYFSQAIPESAAQSQIQAMFLESESQALDARAKVEAGTDFATLAAQLSLDPYSREKKGNLGWHTRDTLPLLLQSALVTDYAFSLEPGALSQPIQDETRSKQVGYWIVKTVERIPDSKDTHVLSMLLASEEQGNTVKARLAAGEDFSAIARELSQDPQAKDNGGDLGFITAGVMGKALDDFIFNEQVPLGTVSDPIRDDRVNTTGGYWLIKVLSREDNRKVGEEEKQLLMNKAVNEWLISLTNDPDNKIENFLDADDMAWAVARVSRESRR